jgi:phospholipid/cholesterol/gamma-HCH transport system substrate-binding protein
VLPRLLRTVAAASPSIRVGTSAARGLVPGYDLPEVITATARTTATLDRADAQLAGLIGNGATTFSAVASTSRALEASLAALPASLRFARSTLGGLDTTLSLVHPVLARLDVAAGPLAPTLIQVRGTASAADTLLRDAVPLLRQLRPASTALGQFARDGRPLIDKLEPGLTQLDDTILPMLGKKDPVTGKPLGTMIGGWGAALGSGAAGGEDANGHFIRFPATIGNANLYLPCQTYIDDFNHAQLLECESLQQTLSTLLGGAAGERRGGSG